MSAAFSMLQPAPPFGWEELPPPIDGRAFSRGRLRVLVSEARELDGKVWLHVSVSLSDRLPSWDQLKQVKDAFVGEERNALQVLPKKSEYVNHHPYVLHLFWCSDGDVTPDFRRAAPWGGMTL